MRLIDADELLEKVGWVNLYSGDSAQVVFSHEIYNAPIIQVEDWISVDERLPEKEGRYLVFNSADTYIMPLKINGVGWKYFVMGNFWPKEAPQITHWMPIPKPPKEADHE